jgi:hypothetical protein
MDGYFHWSVFCYLQQWRRTFFSYSSLRLLSNETAAGIYPFFTIKLLWVPRNQTRDGESEKTEIFYILGYNRRQKFSYHKNAVEFSSEYKKVNYDILKVMRRIVTYSSLLHGLC